MPSRRRKGVHGQNIFVSIILRIGYIFITMSLRVQIVVWTLDEEIHLITEDILNTTSFNLMIDIHTIVLRYLGKYHPNPDLVLLDI